MSGVRRVAAASVLALAVGACAPLPRCAGRLVTAGARLSCPVPGWVDRSFDVDLPSGWDGAAPLPVLIAFHGGGGNKRAALRTTCANGELDDPSCLTAVANTRGLVVVRPDGTGSRPVTNIRTWNAGGGVNGLNCASGPACRAGIDDVAYFDDLLDELAATFPVDDARLYLTGLSNGAAISHRLACERPERVAAIVAVGGANQFQAAGGVCKGPVPVLQIHGTEDPCWGYEESKVTCLEGPDAGIKQGAREALAGWRSVNGCGETPVEEPLPDVDPADGTRVFRVTWPDCQATVEHLRVEGGGHTWPNGHQYFGEDRVGRVTRDINNELIVEFLLAN